MASKKNKYPLLITSTSNNEDFFIIYFKYRKLANQLIPPLKKGYQHIILNREDLETVEIYPFAIKDDFRLYFFSRVLQGSWYYNIFIKNNVDDVGYSIKENRGIVVDIHNNPVIDLHKNYITHLIDFISTIKKEDIML